MRSLSCLLMLRLVLQVSAKGLGSFLGSGLDTITQPMGTAASAAGSSAFATASSFSKGLQTVGQPLGSAAGSFATASAGAAKAIGGGLRDVGKPVESAVVATGAAGKEAAETVGQGVQKEIQAVKQPIDVSLAYVGSSQCQNVQRIFGVTYEQMQGDKEPNLKDLELVYKTKYFTTTMNITQAPASLRQARKFDQDDSLVVFFHGFTDDPGQNSFTNISQSYLEKDRMSVLALDSSSLISSFYLRASATTRNIGDMMGQTLAAIMKQGQDPAKIHLVGHSLGGHIAGYTGKVFQNLTGKKIGRITGLDPAGPCFSHLDPELRLHYSDAEYVDAIHTDGGVYGLKDAVGHKDYYPNSGTLQPNCLLQTCSHSRAWLLYAESVLNPLAFPSVRCRDWAAFKKGDCDFDNISYMGYASKPGDVGSYFLQTGNSYPYGKGIDGCKFVNNEGIVRNVASIVG